MSESDARLRNRAGSIKSVDAAPVERVTESNSSATLPAGESSILRLNLEVRDPEVVRELERVPEGAERDRYAHAALRLGVLSLRQARGQIDGAEVRQAADQLLGDVRALLTSRAGELIGDISGELKRYFDPSTGFVTQRLQSLVKDGGELQTVLKANLGQEDSVMARTLAQHVGDRSPLFRMLSPTESTGLQAQLAQTIETALQQQRDHILKQFSLDQPDSALSRLIEQIKSSQGEMTTEIKDKVDALSREFSLDQPNSALSRLVNNLTLDQEQSALFRLKRGLEQLIADLALKNQQFHTDVRETLAKLETRREESARSTRHGVLFEEQVGGVLSAEAQQVKDLCEETGKTVGVIKNCKKGDHVIRLGPESPAPDAQIVWEAKEDASYDLKHALAELDEARKNRQAQIGVFVFSKKTAPAALHPFERYGSDLVIVWDAEDPATDLYLKAAYSVSRALALRLNRVSTERDDALQGIEQAARAVERQLKRVDEIKTWAETVRGHGEKIAVSATKIREDIQDSVAHLDELVGALKSATPDR